MVDWVTFWLPIFLIFYLLPCIYSKSKNNHHLVIVLGSGGHTSEMFRLIKSLSPSQFHPREYILAMSDTSSLNKALDFEKSMNPSADGYHVHYIQRPREVGQSFSSSFWPLIRATMETGWLFWTLLPDAILCNGPGTCIPMALISLMFRWLKLKHMPIIYVESYARVYTLSLTGKIMYWLSDHFIVQWPELLAKYPKSVYLGKRLV